MRLGEDEPQASAAADARVQAARLRKILAASSLDPNQSQAARTSAGSAGRRDARAFTRAENEDDDGYDPYSDRPATGEPVEADPWD